MKKDDRLLKETDNTRGYFTKKNSNFFNKKALKAERDNCKMSKDKHDYIEINDIEMSEISKKNTIYFSTFAP